ncbi:MAG: (S)-ureidoglycine aminohydrolase [Thermoleophilia bacterium]
MSDRSGSAVRRDHAVISPATHVPGPVPGWSGVEHVQLIGPGMGARFAMSLARFDEGGRAGPPAAGAERLVYVLEGTLRLTHGGATRPLPAGACAHLPPGAAHALAAADAARAVVIDKPYVPVAGVEAGGPATAVAADVAPTPLLGDPDVLVRALLREEPALDLALNLMDFAPGAALPMTEVHSMEHGLLVLEGRFVYRLGDSWYRLGPGDAVWMGPFCPQWACAYGGPARYLIYKDWNRDPLS